ncbi:hypothetical protein Ciccas_011057 [Cichlidogyrus casuarinus]|uniref:V-type proton ATPase subunit C n=1 Tax=Cichlidogyrus casuarinus TaxID=1844966 RepID=A0ABD2PTG8_9PLAT
MSSSEFWFISIPGEQNANKVFKDLHTELTKLQVSNHYKFNIPEELKVGTLDVLVSLSEELHKLDTYTESITRKIAHYMSEVLENQRHKLAENLTIATMDLCTYLSKFQWDSAKYPVKFPLRNLYDIIAEQISKADNDLKAKSAAYNTIKNNLQNLEKKQSGSLLTRNLGDIVKREQFVLGSENMVTLVVVVPKSLYNDWRANYETLCDLVVPRSSELLYEDQDNGLFTATVFVKMADDFRRAARDHKFMVRDFVYDEEKIEESKKEQHQLETDKRKHFGPLFRWLKVNFGECFSALVHIKALRVFVESVLRYGLPVNFTAMMIQPVKKSTKRVRDFLNQRYNYLDTYSSSALDTADEGLGASAMAAVGVQEYHAYVFFKIDTNVID